MRISIAREASIPRPCIDRACEISGNVDDAPRVYTYDRVQFNVRKPIFAHDLTVRRALALAIDRPNILAKLAHGLGYLTDLSDASHLISTVLGSPELFAPIESVMMDVDI